MNALLSGFGLGFGVAAGFGPINVLCLTTGLRSGLAPALGIGLGAAIVDGLYGFLAGLGAAALLTGDANEWFQIVGGVALTAIGIRIARSARSAVNDLSATGNVWTRSLGFDRSYAREPADDRLVGRRVRRRDPGPRPHPRGDARAPAAGDHAGDARLVRARRGGCSLRPPARARARSTRRFPWRRRRHRGYRRLCCGRRRSCDLVANEPEVATHRAHILVCK
jgi:LysE type translocator